LSDEQDKDSKTEAPSEKRIKDALEKGQVPFSPEAGIFTSIAAISVVLLLMFPDAFQAVTGRLLSQLALAGDTHFRNGPDAFHLVTQKFSSVFLVLFPIVAVLALGGIVGSLAQNLPQANLDRVTPKFERMSPKRNLERFYGKQAMIDLVKMSLKVIAVTAVTFWVLRKNQGAVFVSALSDARSIPVLLLDLAKAVVMPLMLLAMAIAAFDVVMARLKWRKNLMMTKHDLKEEFKQSEGDPFIKQKIKSLALQRSKRRMLADVPRATLVITNPTHFAVALRYVPHEGGAPLVIAKGTDSVALKIRELCSEHDISIVENRELARALYPAVDVGSMIPPEFYRAVAEVIHFVNAKSTRPQPYR
jgi:flagellar biosynthesis protein FlhB